MPYINLHKLLNSRQATLQYLVANKFHKLSRAAHSVLSRARTTGYELTAPTVRVSEEGALSVF